MTVENTNSTISYTGNSSVTTFAYNFLTYSTEHLFIYFDDVLQTSGFTITGIGDDNGGDVTFVSPPTTGVTIRIDRTVPDTQLLVYQEYGPFPAKANERGLDLLTMAVQQTSRNSNRGKMDKRPLAAEDNIIVFDDTGNSKDSGKKLSEVGNGGSYIGENPPTLPQQGDRWTRCTDMKGFIYYVDADSAQWVEDRPSYGDDTIGDVSIPYIFETVADYQASTIVFPVGKTIHLKDRGADFSVIAGTGTANGYNIIASTSVNQSANLITTEADLHSSWFGVSRDALQAAVDFYAGQSVAKTLIVDGKDYGSSASELMINAVGGNIIFENPLFDFSVYFYRCLECVYTGNFETTKDVRNIGLLDSTMPSFTCDFFYLQNYAGWGGVNFVRFGRVRAEGVQFRQAKLVSATSSINEVSFESLYANRGSDNNVWNGEGVNFWVRAGRSIDASAPVYTEDGTAPTLTGLDKWESEITCSPLTIRAGDYSYYSNYTSVTRTIGVRNEGRRPFVIQNAFNEGHDIDIIGHVITENYEARGGVAGEFVGGFDRETGTSSDTSLKFANFKAGAEPELSSTEFKKGLPPGMDVSLAGTGSGFVNISDLPVSVVYNGSGTRAFKLINNGISSGSRLTYTFIARKTGRIAVAIKGVGLGQMVSKVAVNPANFGLGYFEDTTIDGDFTSVGAVEAEKGDTVVITLYTKGFSTGNTGEEMWLTGIGIFYGNYAPSIYEAGDDFLESNINSSTNTFVDFITLTGIGNGVGGRFKCNFTGFVVGQGAIIGAVDAFIVITSGNYDAAKSSIAIMAVGSASAANALPAVQIVDGAGANEVKIQLNKGPTGSLLNDVTVTDVLVDSTFGIVVA